MNNLPPSSALNHATLARIKHNVMQRIAALADRHLTVPAADDRWQPFLPGVEIKVLHEHEGVMSYLLRLAPGAMLPPHRHPLDEECVVLEGEVSIGAELAVGAGGFHLARAGTLHAPIASACGALLYLRGAVPEADQLV
jgi:quercetin dioxygenase-like cupin family protein